MFVVALLASAIAAFGPLYLAGADQTTLTTALREAVPANVGLMLDPEVPSNLAALTKTMRALPRPTSGSWYGPAIRTESAAMGLVAHGQPYASSMVARTGSCAHLRIVSGTCSTRPGTAMFSTRSARLVGLRVGSRVEASFGFSAGAHRLLTVSGLYLASGPSTPFWWGENYFGYGTGGPARPKLDDVFVSAKTIRSLVPPRLLSGIVQLPLRIDEISLGAVAPIERALRRFEASAIDHDAVRASTQLQSALAVAATTEHTTATIVAVVDLELALLAVFVLYFVASRTAQDREPDVRLAALHGYRPSSALVVAMSEPVVVVLAAVPVGILLAWAAVHAIAPRVFGAAIAAGPTSLSVGAALAAGLAGIVATATGMRRVLGAAADTPAGSEPVPARRPIVRTIVDVLTVGVAAAAFFELTVVGVSGAGGRTDALAAFAPGLLALGIGVLGARLLPVALRATHRRTAYTPKLVTGYATRRVARRAEFPAVVIMVTIAVGLTAFAVSGWGVARRNRDVRSAFEVGAPKVLSVAVAPGVTFLHAVRASEGSRDDAMAVVVDRAPSGTLLAVDSRSLAAVATWPTTMGISARTLARRLVPHGLAPPVSVSGTYVEVTLDTVRLDSPEVPELSMDLYDPAYQSSVDVTFGPLARGLHRYHASIAGTCPGGCRLNDVALTWTPGTEPTGSSAVFRLDSLEARRRGRWTALGAGIGDATRWTTSPGVEVAASHGGLLVRAKLGALTGSAMVSPRDTPTALPVAVTPETASNASGHGGPLLTGLDGTTIAGHSVAEVPSLPDVGAGATLADLQMAERFVDSSFVTDTTQVWLSSAAPEGFARELRRQGVSVVSEETAAAAAGALAHSGVSLAYLFFLVSAAAGGVLVIGAAAFAVVSSARRKQAELAALGATGLAAGTLRRLLWAEQALAVAVGGLLGAIAGIVAAAVGLRSVPEFVHTTVGPPLDLGLPVTLLALTLVVLVAALTAVTWIGASAVARGATARKLWTDQ